MNAITSVIRLAVPTKLHFNWLLPIILQYIMWWDIIYIPFASVLPPNYLGGVIYLSGLYKMC